MPAALSHATEKYRPSRLQRRLDCFSILGLDLSPVVPSKKPIALTRYCGPLRRSRNWNQVGRAYRGESDLCTLSLVGGKLLSDLRFIQIRTRPLLLCLRYHRARHERGGEKCRYQEPSEFSMRASSGRGTSSPRILEHALPDTRGCGPQARRSKPALFRWCGSGRNRNRSFELHLPPSVPTFSRV